MRLPSPFPCAGADQECVRVIFGFGRILICAPEKSRRGTDTQPNPVTPFPKGKEELKFNLNHLPKMGRRGINPVLPWAPAARVGSVCRHARGKVGTSGRASDIWRTSTRGQR